MGKPIHPLTGDQRQILEEAKIPWLRVTLQVPTRFLAQGQRPGANSTLLWPAGNGTAQGCPQGQYQAPGLATCATDSSKIIHVLQS